MAKKATAKTSSSAPAKAPAPAPVAAVKASPAKAAAKAPSTSCGCEPTSAKPKASPKVTHDMVAKRAYEIWESKGRPVGRDVENWQQAERELGLRK